MNKPFLRLLPCVLALCCLGSHAADNSSASASASTSASASSTAATALLLPNEHLRADGVLPIPASLAAELAPYNEFRPRKLLEWHPKNGKLLLATRGSGNTMQLHLADGPGAPLRQLTDFADPVRHATFEPNEGRYLVYLKDEGGNEAAQAYRLDLESGKSTQLSNPDQKNELGGWDSKGTHIIIAGVPLDRTAKGATRDKVSTEVWIVDPQSPEKKRLLTTLPGGGWGDFRFSPDDKQIVAINTTSANASAVWLFDAQTGAGRELLSAGNAAAPQSWQHARFAKDGRRLFVAGDADGEFLQLRAISLRGGKQQILSRDIPWNMEELDVSPDGKLLAARFNRDGLSELQLFDARSGRRLPQPALPAGAVEKARWDKQSRTLALELNSAQSPGEIISYTPGAKEQVQVWTKPEAGTLDTSKFRQAEIIRWKSFDGRSISGLISRPPQASSKGVPFNGPRPVLIAIHGGPEGQSQIGFLNRYNYMVNEMGVVLIQPNVRGSSGFGKTFLKLDNGMLREDSVKDIGALLDWIASQPDLDAKRVMVQGGSYGGYMSLAVATHYADRIAGAVDVVGISHFANFLERTESYRRDLRRVEYGDERDPQMRAFFDKISPLNNAHKITKPLFVVQGKNDPRVPVYEAEQIVARVKQGNTPVWYLLADNEGHGFQRKNNQEFYMAAVVRFMQEYLLK